jgi:SAM-dependent methyltransferase
MNLTDRNFWLNYWESKTGLVFAVPDSYPFIGQIKAIVQNRKIIDLLEIGGFPGYYCVWLKKHLNLDTTLLDFVVHSTILNDLEQANNLEVGSVAVIETDLFNYQPNKQFDLVTSNGLIEHFEDTADIIQRHLDSLKTGGTLFITLPNFRGLNGWFQRIFDPENYAKHHIPCMDLGFLKSVCTNLNLKQIEVRYDGRFMLWLENESEKPLWVRLLKKTLWLPIKIFFKIIPIETRAFSPYIVVCAVK